MKRTTFKNFRRLLNVSSVLKRKSVYFRKISSLMVTRIESKTLRSLYTKR